MAKDTPGRLPEIAEKVCYALDAGISPSDILFVVGSEINQHKTCHCGKSVYTYVDGFTRNLCADCSDIRCDAPEEGVTYPCYRQMEK